MRYVSYIQIMFANTRLKDTFRFIWKLPCLLLSGTRPLTSAAGPGGRRKEDTGSTVFTLTDVNTWVYG